jgi:hypothetical protein
MFSLMEPKPRMMMMVVMVVTMITGHECRWGSAEGGREKGKDTERQGGWKCIAYIHMKVAA